MSAIIGFNIQHHLPIPHSSYIPQVIKRSRVEAFGQIQSKCFPDSQDDATLESETHLQQPASIFLPSLSFLKKLDPFYAHPSLYMHPPVEAATLQFLSESLSPSSLFGAQASAAAAIL